MKPRKRPTSVLLFCALLIVVVALETMMLAKDGQLFAQAKQMGAVRDAAEWMTAHVARFWLHALLPLVLGVHTYFFYARTSPMMYRGVYAVLTASAGLMRGIEGNFTSIFYWISLILYGLLIVAILRTRKDSPRRDTNEHSPFITGSKRD